MGSDSDERAYSGGLVLNSSRFGWPNGGKKNGPDLRMNAAGAHAKTSRRAGQSLRDSQAFSKNRTARFGSMLNAAGEIVTAASAK